MAEQNQDFVTYKGDSVAPIFTVLDASGNVVDISSVAEITWSARRDLADAVVLTKTKTGGGITFVTNGSDGKFQVAITIADTTALDGYYLHTASITDALGNLTTVTIGRMQVGQAPTWTYDPGALATSSLYQIRFLVGDTLAGDQQMSDGEISFCAGSFANIYLAAAQVARALATKFARQVDLVQGELKTNYSQRSVRYEKLALQLQGQGMDAGGLAAGIYAGGISVQDKISQQQDPDRVQPQFVLGMFENLIVPLPPIGNETQSNPSPSGDS